MTEEEKTRLEIRSELSVYADGQQIPTLKDALTQCDTVVVRSILGALGLPYFNDKIGGNVTTIHNFQQGITALDADYIKFLEYRKGYSSSEIRPFYAERQKEERNKIIKSSAPIISGYTGKELPHDGQAQLEHIVSVGEIESMPENFLFMDQDGRIDLAYNPKNLTMLESNINQSKGDHPLEWWLKHTASGQTEINEKRFGIDVENARKLDQEARKEIKRIQEKKRFEKQASEVVLSGLSSGALLGAREVFAIVLIDFYQEAVACIGKILSRHKSGELSWNDIPIAIKESLCNIKDNVLNEYKVLIEIFFTGMGSGFISNFMLFLINNFITTAKNVSIIARELVYAFARIIKISCDQKRNEIDKNEEIADVLLSSMSICLTILLGEAIKQYLRNVPYNDEISKAVSSIVVGLTAVLVTSYITSVQANQLATAAAVTKTALTAIEFAEFTERSELTRKKKLDQMRKSSEQLSKLKF